MTKQLLEIAEKILEKAAIIIKKTGKATDIFIEAVYEKVKTTGKKIIKQISEKMEGKEVADKIVSYYEPHVRALPKGKVNKPCEFGTKLRIDMTGNKYITNYQLYQGNPADVTMLDKAIENHSKIFPTTFKAAGMDRGFYGEEKIQQLENAYEISLAIPHKKRTDQPLSKRKQKIFNKRSRIEAKISEGKRMTGLNKSNYKGFDGDQITVILSIWALNARQLLRDIKRKPNLVKKLS